MENRKLCLKKSDKLRLKSEFDYIRSKGVKYVGSSVVLVVAPPLATERVCGVICGRKFSTLAVVRNRARRLLWESVRLLKPHISSGRMVMIPRQKICRLKQPAVEKDLRGLLVKAGIWED